MITRTTRTLRRARTQAARQIRRATPARAFDATTEAAPGPAPEAVFDRVTGPFDRRRGLAVPGATDEES